MYNSGHKRISKIGCLSLLTGVIMASLTLWSCSTTKHVPEGEKLLEDVKITITGDDAVKTDELYNFLRQTPNHKVLGFLKLQLATYSLSGRDSTRWYNRWLRNIGQPPVIYDSTLTAASAAQLRQALINRGYMDAAVKIDTISKGHKKIKVLYGISTGKPHVISSMSYDIPDSAIAKIVMSDSLLFTVSAGDIFDRNKLDNERTLIADRLRNRGYYGFSKENIVFIADTVSGSKMLDLTMKVSSPPKPKNVIKPLEEEQITIEEYFGSPENPYSPSGVFGISSVTFYVDAVPGGMMSPEEKYDTIHYKNITVIYGQDNYLKPSILDEKCYLRAGRLYSEDEEEKTYQALGQLGILKFINIELTPVKVIDGITWLEADVLLSRNKKQGISLELEGTNSEGDLGFGLGVTYRHRDLAKGSEALTAKVRGAYESLSGNLDGLINNRFTEYAAEVGITFPKFECPFVSKSFKQKILANTEFAVSFNFQERPEYTRIIAGAAWKYKWTRRKSDSETRHTYDFVDINYVKLPRSTINFIDDIAPANPLLRYSYEDHLIMRMGYSFVRSNRRIPSMEVNAFSIQPSVTTTRFSAETAGNVLYAIARLSGMHRKGGAYKMFGTQFAQYAKAEIDFTHTINFNARSSMAFHAGGGIAVPYGNSSMVPFEKRFYAGGANGVRGWGVRTLGPGCYDSRNSISDFINQCGDIRLDFSMEYRAKLFWVFEGALFIDAGNIWTIRDYENQPGGEFKFNKFYKQLAAAYGVGLRLDFTYFLLRLDLGMKAHNPALGQEQWPLLHPKWGRDSNFHFSVGYPF